MPVELKVPQSGYSITEVQIGRWRKSEGDTVERNEVVVEIETDEAALELPAPTAGTIAKVLKKQGEPAKVGEVIGYLDESSIGRPAPQPAAAPGERLPKEGVAPHVEAAPGRAEEIVPMTPVRRRIAERLVEAQQSAALLTTFNEIDMSAVIALRRDHGPAFQEKHGVKLGFMSFFVKASVNALKLVPQVNAEIRATDIVYRRYYDIGVAVGSSRGLVVPVLRDADHLSFAEIERALVDFAARARDHKLKIQDLEGGTFTISNGGIYGSMLSTPIVNPPQSGILGMHAVQDRPVAREGQVVIRPMMYVALTYDHRLIDGREAVTFLKHIKDVIESPARLLIGA